MCGFCGLVNLDGAPVASELVTAMNERLAHRGPDDSGEYVAGAAGLGHRRLSIVDVSGGAQPMHAGEVTLVANAEIYNHLDLRRDLEAAGHRFATACDTEVILHGYRAWGPGVVERLEGMFAFAIWDGEQRRLLLARDRFGQKPLYYARVRQRFLFASEPKAILPALGEAPAIEPQAIARYLLLDYVPSPWSIYRGVRRLPAAHRMVISAESEHLERYWSLPASAPAGDVAATCESLRAGVERAVCNRLMSDDPVGIFLSGGNDSRIVLREAARAVPGAPPDCFTVGFDAAGFDEAEEASRQAASVGSRHHLRRFDSGISSRPSRVLSATSTNHWRIPPCCRPTC